MCQCFVQVGGWAGDLLLKALKLRFGVSFGYRFGIVFSPWPSRKIVCTYVSLQQPLPQEETNNKKYRYQIQWIYLHTVFCIRAVVLWWCSALQINNKVAVLGILTCSFVPFCAWYLQLNHSPTLTQQVQTQAAHPFPQKIIYNMAHMYSYIRYRYRFFLWTLSFLKIWIHFLKPDVHLYNTSYYVGFERCSYVCSTSQWKCWWQTLQQCLCHWTSFYHLWSSSTQWHRTNCSRMFPS